MSEPYSEFLQLLCNRVNLRTIPFTERGSRILIFREDDHFSVRLAERWYKATKSLSAYRSRPPLLDDWRLTDADGHPLQMNVTSYPHRLDCQTEIGSFTFAFLDAETLLITPPERPCGMTWMARMDQVWPDRRGGVLRIVGDVHRNVAYTTNARILHNEASNLGPKDQRIDLRIDPAGGNCAILMNITPRLGFNRWVPEPVPVLDAARKRWHDWFAAAPEVAAEYRRQYYYAWWVMRAGLVSTRYYTTREAMTPSKIYYVGVWQWDSLFHSLAYRHLDPGLAKDQIRIVLDHQREDGMLPDAVFDEGTVTHLDFPVDADVTKPPLGAWAVWKLYEQFGDREFLEEVYEPLVHWNRWWYEKNDADMDGLCEYQHPFSSGLDDNPLWDGGMPVQSPDLNTYLCLQQEALARIATVLGLKEDAEMWEERVQRVVQRLLKRMWDEKTGLFLAIHNEEFIHVHTPFNLLPLVTGRMPPGVTARLVEHLTNESEFWSRYPLPTVAMNDPDYNPLQMWRGPTWVNVNYLFIEGLMRCGYVGLGRELRRRTLEMVNMHEDIFEYYHPQTGEVGPKAASIFGWSSALYIDLAIQATREAQMKQLPLHI